MNKNSVFLFGVLCLMGAGWGATQPLSKIAVSEGYRHFGLIFWQFAIGAIALTLVQLARRKPIRITTGAITIWIVIALLGTVIPNSISFEVLRFLPSGLTSIILALVPMFAFPVAIALGNEKFAWKRFLGLGFGLAGVLLIIGPEASLPDRSMVFYVLLAMIGPLCYGFEGNVVARWGTAGLDPIEVLLGASYVGMIIALPLAITFGHFIDPRGPWGAPDFALVLSSLIHICVYTAYVWLVGRAGPVYAVQVAYLVTGFGVIWAMLILSETYALWVWLAMALMLVGVFLVQPRPKGETQPMLDTAR